MKISKGLMQIIIKLKNQLLICLIGVIPKILVFDSLLYYIYDERFYKFNKYGGQGLNSGGIVDLHSGQ